MAPDGVGKGKRGIDMRAIITVIGNDQKGIIAKVGTCLYQREVNVLDITQTLLQEYFTMVMLVDITDCTCSFEALQQALCQVGAEMNLSIRIQSEEIFNAMHRI
jgi:ACT domain-containing protein